MCLEEKAVYLWRGMRGALYLHPEPNPKVKDRVRETEETGEHALIGTRAQVQFIHFYELNEKTLTSTVSFLDFSITLTDPSGAMSHHVLHRKKVKVLCLL